MSTPAGRVRVTGTAARNRTGTPRRAAAEPGAVHVRSLMRAQFLLALRVTAVMVAVVGGLPLVFALGPGLARTRVAGLPLPWVVLGGCVQPVWIAIAAYHVRRAERAEREFADLVERS